jgi:4-aminobutyrate aminotransferase-like enzyme
VEVCRRLAAVFPGPGDAYKSVLVNSGAEAVENAIKVARAATGRPAVIAFERAFHGRTLLTMGLTSKVAYKRGFGPFAPEVYRAPLSIDGLRAMSIRRASPAWSSSRCRARAASTRCRRRSPPS